MHEWYRKWCEIRRSCPKRANILDISWRDWRKPRKFSVSIADIAAEIRTENPPEYESVVLPTPQRVQRFICNGSSKCTMKGNSYIHGAILLHFRNRMVNWLINFKTQNIAWKLTVTQMGKKFDAHIWSCPILFSFNPLKINWSVKLLLASGFLEIRDQGFCPLLDI
jgi:hypothetical protein